LHLNTIPCQIPCSPFGPLRLSLPHRTAAGYLNFLFCFFSTWLGLLHGLARLDWLRGLLWLLLSLLLALLLALLLGYRLTLFIYLCLLSLKTPLLL